MQPAFSALVISQTINLCFAMRKTFALQLFFVLLLPFILVSCKKNDPIPVKNDLVITIQDQFTSAPAKVSVFFKVETKSGKPVAGLKQTDFTIFEKGRNDTEPKEISEFEAERKISDNSQIFNYSTILILDLSASVTDNYLAELKEASKSFVDAIMPEGSNVSYYMGIYWFDGEDKLHNLVPFTLDKTTLKTGIDNITANISADNSTDLFGAVIKGTQIATNELATIQQKGILAASSVVTFTDGTDQAGRYTKSAAVSALTNANADMSFFTIGLGGEIDAAVLQELGPNGTAFANNKEELVEKFQEIGQVVSDKANSYYLFEYCSPKRDGSGTNELTLRVIKDNKIGSESTTFQATGFTGGCAL